MGIYHDEGASDAAADLTSEILGSPKKVLAPEDDRTWTRSALGAYIRSAYGDRVYIFEDPASAITLESAAHSLGMQCRYGGHCVKFYSVAEHCCLLSDFAMSLGEAGLAAALHFHDMLESVTQDKLGPIKRHMIDFQGWERSVASSFGRKWPICRAYNDPHVAHYDRRIMTDEFEQNMIGGTAGESWLNPHPLGVALRFWTPEVAKAHWLDRAHNYLEMFPRGVEL